MLTNAKGASISVPFFGARESPGPGQVVNDGQIIAPGNVGVGLFRAGAVTNQANGSIASAVGPIPRQLASCAIRCPRSRRG
jgi:hypothetical protein